MPTCLAEWTLFPGRSKNLYVSQNFLIKYSYNFGKHGESSLITNIIKKFKIILNEIRD